MKDERIHGAACAYHEHWLKQIEQAGVESDACWVATDSASLSCEVKRAWNAVPVGLR